MRQTNRESTFIEDSMEISNRNFHTKETLQCATLNKGFHIFILFY